MDPLVKGLLLDMLREAEAATELTDVLAAETIASHSTLSRALSYSLAVIGEAAAQMPKDFQIEHPALAWNEARALRNRIIHGYRSVIPEILVETAREDLPVLIAQIKALLAEIPE